MNLIEKLTELLQSEAVRVELIALCFIATMFLLFFFFRINLRKALYPSILILILFPLLWFGIQWIITQIKNTKLPDWLSATFTSWWFWVAITVAVLLIIFRKSLKVNITGPKSWVVAFVWLAVAAFILYFTLPRLISYFKGSGEDGGVPTEVNLRTPVDPSHYRPFILHKENTMVAGVWYTFYQGDGPLLNFKPKDPNQKVTYRIVKQNDETLEWKVEVTTDSKGVPSENRLNPHGVEPNKAAKHGASRIMVDQTVVMENY